MRFRFTWFLAGAAALCWSALPSAGDARAADIVEHKVRSGDNLHLIAGYYYRDPRQWQRIWKLNKKEVRNPDVLRVGGVIRVELEPGLGWDVPYEEFVAKTRHRK